MVAFPSLTSLKRPTGLSLAIAVGIAVALVSLMIPNWIVERMVVKSGIAAILPAAEPPLGYTARLGIAFFTGIAVTLGAMLAVIGMAGLKEQRGTKRRRRSRTRKVDTGLPTIRRADAHPDAPPRAPLLATRDLGTPPEGPVAPKPAAVLADDLARFEMPPVAEPPAEQPVGLAAMLTRAKGQLSLDSLLRDKPVEPVPAEPVPLYAPIAVKMAPVVERIEPDMTPEMEETSDLNPPISFRNWQETRRAAKASAAIKPVVPPVPPVSIETPVPHDLNQTLASIDPVSILDWPTAPVTPPATPPVISMPSADPVRIETFELTPTVRTSDREPAVETSPPAAAIAAPETDATIVALLDRLERGIASRGKPVPVDIKAGGEGLADTLVALRRMASGG